MQMKIYASNFIRSDSILWALLQVLWTDLFTTASSQCPQVRPPCSCTLNQGGGSVDLLCNNAISFDEAMGSLGNVQNVGIKTLIVQNTPIAHLSDFAFQGLAVNRLVLNYNGLTSIGDRAFEGPMREVLTELDLKNNQIGQVPISGGIPTLRRLRTLILAKNRIQQLPDRPFYKYDSKNFLGRVDLSGNFLTQIDRNFFENLQNLEEISLEANQIEFLPVPLFADLPRLKNLNLGLNKLGNIPPGALNFRSLESLSLEFNNLTFLPAETFAQTPRLNYLSLTGNKFPYWDPNVFRYVGGLKILGMGETPITRIPQNAFQYVRNLVRLEMTESAVDSIDQGTFQQIGNIETIVLNKNRLKRINASTFQMLPKLESLDLSGNQLATVDERSLANLPSLKHLDISSNNLQTLQSGTFFNTFATNSKTRVLYCCDNPWSCDGSLSWFRRWLRINPDIVIDKPPSCIALCRNPSQLTNWPLRADDPPFPTEGPTLPWTLPSLDDDSAPSNLGWIILAIILAILLTSIMLLAITRYFVSHKRRRDKEEEMARMVSSAASMHQGSLAGSAYPGASMMDLNLPPVTNLYDRGDPYSQTY